MKYERAVEIFNSLQTIEVLYDGRPVWIDSLDSGQKMVTISSGDLEDGRQTVSVNQLTETGGF